MTAPIQHPVSVADFLDRAEKRPVVFGERRPDENSKVMTMQQALRCADRLMPAELRTSGFRAEVFASDTASHGGRWFRVSYGKRA